jgi:hypothetical protein
MEQIENGESLLSVRNKLNGLIAGQEAGFTFLVDSDAALAAWATNADGNDYTHVLIKKGTWTSALAVNLTAAGTKVVVGQAGNLLSFTGTRGLTYNTLAGDDCWMQGVNVLLTVSPNFGIAIYRARNLVNCTSNVIGNDQGASFAFNECQNMIGCKGVHSGVGTGFYQCRILLMNAGTGFSGCYMHDTGTTDPVGDTAAGGWNRVL